MNTCAQDLAFKYHITVEPASAEAAPKHNPQTKFDFATYEDMLNIVEKVVREQNLDKDDGHAMGLGIKLVADVVRRNRNKAPFDRLAPLVEEAVQILKGRA